MGEEVKFFELNTIMMKSTYKIEGKGFIGTCFLIGKPSKTKPDFAHFVLVTAAHVLEKMEDDKATIFLRKTADHITYEKFPYRFQIRQGSKELWLKNPSGIDVAVMYIDLPKETDFALLTTDMFANDEVLSEFEIHPGDELFCLGYPLGAEANDAGFPILRSGKISSFPLIPTKKNISFLLDLRIFRGNSGGPVYFVESNRNYKGGTHIGKIQFIAGLVSREHYIIEKIESLYETKEQIHSLGLATVIHASHILDTIEKLPEKD